MSEWTASHDDNKIRMDQERQPRCRFWLPRDRRCMENCGLPFLQQPEAAGSTDRSTIGAACSELPGGNKWTLLYYFSSIGCFIYRNNVLTLGGSCYNNTQALKFMALTLAA